MLTPETIAEYEDDARGTAPVFVEADDLREMLRAYRRLAEIEAAWGLRPDHDDWSDLTPDERPRF